MRSLGRSLGFTWQHWETVRYEQYTVEYELSDIHALSISVNGVYEGCIAGRNDGIDRADCT